MEKQRVFYGVRTEFKVIFKFLEDFIKITKQVTVNV